MSDDNIIGFTYASAPHDLARSLMRLTCDPKDFDSWLSRLIVATNDEARRRGLSHRDGIAEATEPTDCSEYIDLFTDEQLAQQQQWIRLVCAFTRIT